ncbi:MAG: hypothetical protein H0V66_12530 [Bdellovibrionales bacterium]|nr:hypothetical protein [Bdellovibrionales bacterium]
MVLLDERNFLGKQLEDQGFNIFDFYEGHQTFSLKTLCELPLNRRADVLLVDTQTILNHPELQEKFKVVLNTFLGVIFFHEQQNVTAQSWVQDQAAFLTKIIGEYSLPMPQLEWTMLSNQLQFLWNMLEDQKNLQKHIVKFSQELDLALQSAESEMQKAKKIHEVLIPKRSDEIKGVTFLNKYASGDGGGGEFYDLHHVGNKVFQILISSQSYLISSSLIGLLNIHKQKDFQPESFLQDAKAEIQTINGAKKKKSEVELVILEMDTSHLTLKSHGWGKAEIYSQLKGKIDLGLSASHESSVSAPYQLAKGEKLVVFSPGFIFNWREGRIKHELYSFLKNHHQLTQTDLMMEIFLQLSLVKETDFLSKDATVVMMEVNRHGIHQI